MKASMFLVGASAILASASPIRAVLDKRAMETEWVYKVVTVTVVAGEQEAKKVEPTGAVYLEEPEKPAPKPTKEAAKPKPVYEQPAAPKPKPVYEQPAAPKPSTTTTTTKEAPKPTVVEPEPEPTYVAPKPSTTTTKEAPKPTVVEPKPEPKPVDAGSSFDLSLDGAYDTIMLAYHNIHRANHSASALEWDDTLAGYAENTANGCVFEHDMEQGNGGYGQNLASWGATSDIDDLKNKAAAGGITNQWYNSEMANWAFYGQENPPADMDILLYGHFTQVVWKDSTKVGCATVKCPAGSVLSFPAWYTVCNYNPPGNFGGKYAENVLKPDGAKRVTV
ncbi:hypothetical protein F66182_396 [Fusarium sp. NRRL 66182]|nr:hypothetical protein F66182_396 [Fusarium sp. NRRL 66182]